jgi:hypothetical protein
MKKCKGCQKEIDPKAKKCPYCQTDQRNWFVKHPILTGILLLVIIGIIGASTNSGTKKVGTTGTTQTISNEATQPTTPEAPPTKTYKMGDLVDLNGKTMAVNAVAPYTSGNQFIAPKSGNKFVTVDITLQNNSKDPYTYNVLEFKLHDNQDYGYDMAVSDKEPTLSTGTIQPGEKTRGFITFEIPVNNTPAKLVYTPGFWNLSQIIVDLTK